MSTPEPNSPEALLAARKIRDLFFAFVVLNLVLFAVVMCTSPSTPPSPAKAPQPTPTPTGTPAPLPAPTTPAPAPAQP